MFPNAFIGKSEAPSVDELESALGSAGPRWHGLISQLAADLGELTAEWKCYSPKAGWTLKLLKSKRAVLYLCPSLRRFEAALVLGDRAVELARQSGLPDEVMELIDNSPKYPEGTSFRTAVLNARDMKLVRQLAAIKMRSTAASRQSDAARAKAG
jgi:hypothetical protein